MTSDGVVRVSAYCRVSTDKSDQINSFEAQKSFFQQYVKNHKNWSLAGIYSDEGVTGTSVKGRQGFSQMIAAAERGEVDLIITKEISRFARNTLDSIYYTRALKRLGVSVLFLCDGINTAEADAELRLTILSSVAQEESRKTSERVKWGQRRQMEKGVVFGRSLLGYRLENGQLFIDPEEARLVKRIFELYTEKDMGAYAIAELLNRERIRGKRGGERWQASSVLRILKNEKYAGDLLQQKTYTSDYLSHEKRVNRGEVPQVMIKGHHPAIVPPSVFEAARELMKKRGAEIKRGGERYGFSGRAVCAICGGSYTSKYKNNKSGGYRLWRCTVGCGNRSVRDSELKLALKKEFSQSEIKKAVRFAHKALMPYCNAVSEKDIEMRSEGVWSDGVVRALVKKVYISRGEFRFELNL